MTAARTRTCLPARRAPNYAELDKQYQAYMKNQFDSSKIDVRRMQKCMRPWKLAEVNYGIVKEQLTRWRCCRWGPPSRTTCTCPTAPTFSRPTWWARRSARPPGTAGRRSCCCRRFPTARRPTRCRFPLAMNLNPATLSIVMGDLVESLARHGIHKIVLLNSHGGNDLKPVLRELYGQTPAKLFLCNWYTAFKDLYQRHLLRGRRPRRRDGDLVHAGLSSRAGRAERRRHAWRPTRAGRPPRGSRRSIAAGSRSPGPGIC